MADGDCLGLFHDRPLVVIRGFAIPHTHSARETWDQVPWTIHWLGAWRRHYPELPKDDQEFPP